MVQLTFSRAPLLADFEQTRGARGSSDGGVRVVISLEFKNAKQQKTI